MSPKHSRRVAKRQRYTMSRDFISSTLPMPDWFIQDVARAKGENHRYMLQKYQAVALLKRAMRFVDGFVTSGMVRYEYDYDDPNPWIKIQILLKPPQEPVVVSEEPPG